MPQIDIFQVRRDTAARWFSINPVLAAGEQGLETDTLKSKWGDGTTPWNGLSYAVAGGNGDMVLAAAQAVTGVKTFSPNTLLVAGATSGSVTLNSAAVAGGTLTFPNATDTVVCQNTTDTLTNKTMSGASNTLTALPAAGISGVIPVANLGTGTPNGAKYLRDDGTFQVPAGSGDMILNTIQVVTALKTFGGVGAVSKFALAGTTSGTTILDATAVAGATTLTLPAATDTLIAKATTDTLTNKTMSGASNTFSALPAAGITGVIPIANLATGTPTGLKFIRDDGTLQVVGGGGDALVANPLSQFGATTSAQLAGVITNETGTGALVFATSPSLVTPSLDVATATSINKVTITAPATSATLTIPDGVVLTGPAASGTAMTLGNTETITGPKTFNSTRFILAGSTSGTTSVNATAIASGILTMPAATDTIIGKATTDTLTNKTYDTAGVGNSFSINSLAATANTGTGSVVRATSPTLATPTLTTPVLSGAASGTGTLPATVTMVASPAQADNSLKIATTAYVDTLGATKATAAAAVALTGANSLTTAAHSNRHLSWTGAATAAQALPASGQISGDLIELTNDGTAIVTFTGGAAAAPGYTTVANPGETINWIYTTSWESSTATNVSNLPQNSKSANYTTVATDAGKHIFHPSSDVTARVFTIDSNANVAYPIGTTLTFVTDSAAGVVTIAITADQMVLAGSAGGGSFGSRTLATNSIATALKTTTTKWIINGAGLT